MGQSRQFVNNGVLVWQVNRVITERMWVENANGTRSEVKNKVRLRGTAPTKNLARQRLEQKYKEYLVKSGELPVEALGLAQMMIGGQFYTNLSEKNRQFVRWSDSRGCWQGGVIMTHIEDWRKEYYGS